MTRANSPWQHFLKGKCRERPLMRPDAALQLGKILPMSALPRRKSAK